MSSYGLRMDAREIWLKDVRVFVGFTMKIQREVLQMLKICCSPLDVDTLSLQMALPAHKTKEELLVDSW